MKEKHSQHAVHRIQYHIIWCTKFRHEVLVDAVEVATKNIIAQTCAHYDWDVIELEVMPDHVHLLVSPDHTVSPNEIAKALKSISAVHLFAKFHHLKKNKFWGSGLWSPSTFYGTVGETNEEVVANYIRNQHKK